MSMGQQVIQGLKVGGGLRVLAQLFTGIGTLILIRLLSEDDYGLMAMTMAFIGLFALLGDLGMGKTLIQKDNLTHLQYRQAFTINLLCGLLLFVSFYAMAPWIARFFHEPVVGSLIEVAALQFLVMIFHTLPSAAASRQMRFKAREKVHFLALLLTSAITLIMAFAGFGVWALVYGHLFLKLAVTVGLMIIAPCWAAPTLNFRNASQLTAFGSLTTINDVLRYFVNVSGNLSVGRLLSKADLGVFSVARNLANLPSDKLGELLNHLGLASMAKVQNHPTLAAHYLGRSMQLAGFTVFPVYFGLCAIAPDFIPLILSEKWASLVVPFQILCLASPFRLLSELLATCVTAMGAPNKNTQALLFTLLTLPLLVVGIHFGIAGACWAWLSIHLLSFLWHLRAVLPTFQLSMLSLLNQLMPGFLCAVMMLCALVMISPFMTEQLPQLLSLTLLVLIGALLFAALQLTLFRQRFCQTLRWLKH